MIYITRNDLTRLEELLESFRDSGQGDKEHLADLEEELEKAEIVEPQDIPSDVITLNSKVKLKDLDSNKEMIYTLVFPFDADISQNKISILAPIGTAMIGYRVGDVIEWHVPSGIRRLEVVSILYQPEAAGDFHL